VSEGVFAQAGLFFPSPNSPGNGVSCHSSGKNEQNQGSWVLEALFPQANNGISFFWIYNGICRWHLFHFFAQNLLWKYCNPYVQRVPDLLHHFYLGIIKRYLGYVVDYLRENGGDEKVDEFDKAFSSIGFISGVKVRTNETKICCPQTLDSFYFSSFSFFHSFLLWLDFQKWNLEVDSSERWRVCRYRPEFTARVRVPGPSDDCNGPGPGDCRSIAQAKEEIVHGLHFFYYFFSFFFFMIRRIAEILPEHFSQPLKFFFSSLLPFFFLFFLLFFLSWQRSDLNELHESQQNLEKALVESNLSSFCKSKMNLVKMHDLSHHILAILLFEDPASYSTQAGERLNGRKVKVPYQKGNKKDNDSWVKDFLFGDYWLSLIQTSSSHRSKAQTTCSLLLRNWRRWGSFADQRKRLRSPKTPRVSEFCQLLD